MTWLEKGSIIPVLPVGYAIFFWSPLQLHFTPLHGIKLIKKYLTKDETKMLLTSNFYSVLYYNSEIWLSNSLKVCQKQQLLAASSNALKMLNNVSDLRISYVQLHSKEKEHYQRILQDTKWRYNCIKSIMAWR